MIPKNAKYKIDKNLRTGIYEVFTIKPKKKCVGTATTLAGAEVVLRNYRGTQWLDAGTPKKLVEYYDSTGQRIDSIHPAPPPPTPPKPFR